jgi:hypothetical protein
LNHLDSKQLEDFTKNPVWVELVKELEKTRESFLAELLQNPHASEQATKFVIGVIRGITIVLNGVEQVEANLLDLTQSQIMKEFSHGSI